MTEESSLYSENIYTGRRGDFHFLRESVRLWGKAASASSFAAEKSAGGALFGGPRDPAAGRGPFRAYAVCANTGIIEAKAMRPQHSGMDGR